MVVAKATKPKSAGISNRARIIVLIRPIAWMASCAPTVQLLPIAISWARLEDFVRWNEFVGRSSEEVIDLWSLKKCKGFRRALSG